MRVCLCKPEHINLGRVLYKSDRYVIFFKTNIAQINQIFILSYIFSYEGHLLYYDFMNIKRQSRPSNLQHRKNGKTDLLRVNPLMYSFTLFETLPIVCLEEPTV